MEYQIKLLNKSTLEAYVNSESYLQSDIWPISFHEVASLVNNPRLDPGDVILVVAEFESRLVGCQSILSDWVFSGNKKHKAGWLSASWIGQEHRRKGLADILLNEVSKAWNGRLLFSSQSTKSNKKVSVNFVEYLVKNGCRFHMKSNLTESLPLKYPFLKRFDGILPAADFLFNDYVLPFITDMGMKSRLSYSILIKSKLNEEECALLFEKNLTRRTSTELNWAIEFPWILELNEMDEKVMHKYSFTAGADSFKQYFCVIYKSGVLIAIVMISLKDQQMKVPYYYSADMDIAMIADLIFNEAWKNTISHIDVFEQNLVAEMKLKSAYFAFSKSKNRSYFVSKEIIAVFPEVMSIKVPDGEGDMIFS